MLCVTPASQGKQYKGISIEVWKSDDTNNFIYQSFLPEKRIIQITLHPRGSQTFYLKVNNTDSNNKSAEVIITQYWKEFE